MKIIRTTMFLALAAFIAPSPPPDTTPGGYNRQQLAVMQRASVIAAAASTVSDVSSFCSRQKGVCDTAMSVLWHMEAKAKYNVRLLYEWANGTPARRAPGNGNTGHAVRVDPVITGSRAIIIAGASAPVSQSTLTLEDLIPEWRGPRASSNS